MAPAFHGRMAAVADWGDVKLLTVAVDRLVQWYRPGFLCIGDAAHAMSPIGGVGINLAIQDAVAASNICAVPLREGRCTTEHLRALQHRRELPTRLIQLMQVFIQQRVLRPILRDERGRTRTAADADRCTFAVAAQEARNGDRRGVAPRTRGDAAKKTAGDVGAPPLIPAKAGIQR
jgi:2-polyprenyl-6-methoxyphenol hydroxylase-like FAD-dependent oxidoreductase